jgi:hypothetical protein
MKMIYIFLIIVLSVIIYSCKTKNDNEIFKDILNDSRINSKEVGERNGIKFFQYMENDKTGFRDLDGNIVIKAIYDSAEMFSEEHSAVEINGKWGLINEKGDYIIKLKYDRLGDLKNSLLSFRDGDKVGFLNINEEIIIKPEFYWADEFSEGLCVVSTDFRSKEPRKYGYIDTTGKLVVDYIYDDALKFENGKGIIRLNKYWGAIDKTGKIIAEPIHKQAFELN